jgi:hypothetical protein
MKKILTYLIIFLFSIVSITSISSAPKYGAAGCGLGSLIIKEAGFAQVVAATTNGIYGNQTFGITTGSLGCTADGVVKSDKEQEIFVHTNIDSLEQEMAAGKGEKLNTLATLFGCPKDSQKNFASMTQKKYGTLFTNEVRNSPSDLISAIKMEISKDNNLATSCKI